MARLRKGLRQLSREMGGRERRARDEADGPRLEASNFC